LIDDDPGKQKKIGRGGESGGEGRKEGRKEGFEGSALELGVRC
jgi:hypothetical protein